ncbi:MAG: hypothetical protein DMF89_21190 [Acidobacteria bacterium]|nr:MAG: hypothetical protein DMF89_21190 [Acidobacteriota bacterium]
MKTVAFAILLSAVTTPLAAQWLTHPTPGIPRTADGRPNLAAPAPRTPDGKPDLTGLWQRMSTYWRNIAVDLEPGEVQPWADALVQRRLEDLGIDHPSHLCLPWGPNYSTSQRRAKIVQTPGLIIILDEDLTYRQVFLDGRELEAKPNPSWMGYSVGRWEGDTLVVESFGFKDRTWLDQRGHPHTEGLRTTERYRRRDFGHLDIQVTLDDPAAYARPWTVALRAELRADTELFEEVCNESPSQREHWIGKASDDQKSRVQVATDVLAKYVGTYQELDPWGPGPHPRVINITVSDGALFAELRGEGKERLVPQSETRFSGFFGLGISFVVDSQGVPTHLLEMHVSGNYRFSRTK